MKLALKKYKSETLDRNIGKFLAMYLSVQLIYNVFRRVLGLGTGAANVFLGGLLFVCILLNMQTILEAFGKRSLLLVGTELLFVGIYAASFVLYGNLSSGTLVSYLVNTCIVCIPLLTIGSAVQNRHELYEGLRNGAYVLTVFGGFVVFATGETLYNMNYSYIMLLPLLFFTNEFLAKRKTFHALCVCYILLLIIFFGSRGPLLCFAIYLAMRLIFTEGNRFFKIVFILLAGIGYYNFQAIGNGLIGFLEKHGIYNRTLTLIFTQTTYVSGRDTLQESAFALLNQHQWTGLGVASDIDLMGQYPHNLFIELLFDYGYILGIVAILFVVCALLRFLKERKDREISILLICWSFFPLMVSGSYLKEWKFFFLMGVIYSALHMKKKRIVPKAVMMEPEG